LIARRHTLSTLFPYTTLFRSHHVLFRDQVLDRELALVGHDFGAPLVAEAVRQLRELLFQDLQASRLRPEDLLALLDELADFLERSEAHTSELQSPAHHVCRLL